MTMTDDQLLEAFGARVAAALEVSADVHRRDAADLRTSVDALSARLDHSEAEHARRGRALNANIGALNAEVSRVALRLTALETHCAGRRREASRETRRADARATELERRIEATAAKVEEAEQDIQRADVTGQMHVLEESVERRTRRGMISAVLKVAGLLAAAVGGSTITCAMQGGSHGMAPSSLGRDRDRAIDRRGGGVDAGSAVDRPLRRRAPARDAGAAIPAQPALPPTRTWCREPRARGADQRRRGAGPWALVFGAGTAVPEEGVIR